MAGMRGISESLLEGLRGLRKPAINFGAKQIRFTIHSKNRECPIPVLLGYRTLEEVMVFVIGIASNRNQLPALFPQFINMADTVNQKTLSIFEHFIFPLLHDHSPLEP